MTLDCYMMLKIFSKNFEISYVVGVEIFYDRSQELLGLSHKAYFHKILVSFRMNKCSAKIVPIQKGDKFHEIQCPKNDLECKEIKLLPYASLVGSLMSAQTCTQSDISFIVRMLV